MQETIDEIYAEECTASWFLRPKPPCIPNNLVILRKNSRFCGCIEFGLVVNKNSVISYCISLKSGKRNSDSIGVCVLKI